MKNNGFVLALTLVSSGALLSGCGANTASSNRSYAGSGSDWRWTLKGDGTFTATESGTSSTVGGTYTTSANGFQVLKVTSTSGSGPAVGTIIPVMEIPGYAAFAAPVLSSESQLIAMISAGSCPTASFSTNYLYMQFNNSIDMTATNRDFFGVFTWDVASGSGTTSSQYALANSFQSVSFPSTITGSCSGGILTTSNFTAYMTQGGTITKITQSAASNYGDGIISMPAATLGSASALAGNYAGFIYDPASSVKIRALIGTLSGSSLTVSSVSSTDTVTADGAVSGTMNISAVDSPSTGFIKGTVGSSPIVCMGNTNVLSSGKRVLFCLGQNPSNATKPYSVMLVSR